MYLTYKPKQTNPTVFTNPQMHSTSISTQVIEGSQDPHIRFAAYGPGPTTEHVPLIVEDAHSPNNAHAFHAGARGDHAACLDNTWDAYYDKKVRFNWALMSNGERLSA